MLPAGAALSTWAPTGSLSDARTEPIAADARPGKDGKNNAKLKLIAAVLGVGFDAAAPPRAAAAQPPLFVIACAATVGMVPTTALAAFALIQRAAAQKQEARAEREADAATQTTEFLIGMFRIIDPSEARGNTVTAREMLDKGAARIDEELTQQPAIQARLMDTLGTVYTGLGLYSEAQPLLERAVDEAPRLARCRRSTVRVTQSLRGAAEPTGATTPRRKRPTARPPAASRRAPKNQRSRSTLANSLFGLGVCCGAEGRYPEAERTLREALAMQHRAVWRQARRHRPDARGPGADPR